MPVWASSVGKKDPGGSANRQGRSTGSLCAATHPASRDLLDVLGVAGRNTRREMLSLPGTVSAALGAFDF